MESMSRNLEKERGRLRCTLLTWKVESAMLCWCELFKAVISGILDMSHFGQSSHYKSSLKETDSVFLAIPDEIRRI